MLNVAKEYRNVPKTIRQKMNEANIYYSEIYYENEKKQSEVYYIYDNAEILILLIQKKLFFRFAVLPTEPCVFGENVDIVNFLDEMVLLGKSVFKVDWIGSTGVTALFPAAPKTAQTIPFGSYIIDLSLSEEKIWADMHSKHRNVIRKAEKDGVIIQAGGTELLEDYCRLDEVTWKRSGETKKLFPVYQKLLTNYKGYAVLYMAYSEDGEPQGGAVFLKNKAMSYYLYGASKNSPTTGAMNYLHWTAIRDFKKEGIRQYNFVGCRINEDLDSKYHGIQRFKKRFGGALFVGKMFKVIVRPYRYKLFRFLQCVKQGHVVEDIIDQEIDKWKT